MGYEKMLGKVLEMASSGKQGDARDGLGLVELTGLQSSEAKSQLWSRGNKRRMLLLRSLPSSLLPLSLSARVRRQRSHRRGSRYRSRCCFDGATTRFFFTMVVVALSSLLSSQQQHLYHSVCKAISEEAQE